MCTLAHWHVALFSSQPEILRCRSVNQSQCCTQNGRSITATLRICSDDAIRLITLVSDSFSSPQAHAALPDTAVTGVVKASSFCLRRRLAAVVVVAKTRNSLRRPWIQLWQPGNKKFGRHFRGCLIQTDKMLTV
jgi:hypothetical protein